MLVIENWYLKESEGEIWKESVVTCYTDDIKERKGSHEGTKGKIRSEETCKQRECDRESSDQKSEHKEDVEVHDRPS